MFHRILHIISSLDPLDGGTTAACAGMASAQANAGLIPSIVTTACRGQQGSIATSLEPLLGDGTIVEVGPTWGPLRSHSSLSSVLQACISSAEVIHIHGVWEDIQFHGMRLAREAGKPIVWSPHGMLEPWPLKQSRLKKQIYWVLRLRRFSGSVTAVHFITQREKRLSSSLFGPEVREIIEPLGIDHSTGQPGSKDPYRILFLSRIHPKKNLELLLEAFSLLEGDQWSLCVAGSGDASYLAELQDRCLRLGISKRVSFVGHLSGQSKETAFADAGIFALPSYQENFGIAVLEAVAAGLPVVLNPEVGVGEDLAHLPFVFMKSPDPKAWAMTFASIAEDSRLQGLAAAQGPAHIAENYSWKAIGEQWVCTYRTLV